LTAALSEEWAHGFAGGIEHFRAALDDADALCLHSLRGASEKL